MTKSEPNIALFITGEPVLLYEPNPKPFELQDRIMNAKEVGEFVGIGRGLFQPEMIAGFVLLDENDAPDHELIDVNTPEGMVRVREKNGNIKKVKSRISWARYSGLKEITIGDRKFSLRSIINISSPGYKGEGDD